MRQMPIVTLLNRLNIDDVSGVPRISGHTSDMLPWRGSKAGSAKNGTTVVDMRVETDMLLVVG
jgi:hypothetical protein